MSTNTGFIPQCKTEAMSEIQVRVGTITSPTPKVCLLAAMVMRLADAPELTKTLCFTPSHSDHSRSKASTCRDWVRMGSPSRRNAMSASRSARVMLLDISGHLPCGAAWEALGVTSCRVESLFIVVVTIFHQERALAIRPLQRFLITRKNHFRFIQADDLRVNAHHSESLGEITYMLELRMQRPL